MKKADHILIVCIMVVSLVLLVPLLKKSTTPEVAIVQVKNEEVLRIDLHTDGQYEVQGSLGPVHIEVKEGAVRVSQENSPHHYCSMQGFVDHVNEPIVCLPNETVITIEGVDAKEDVMLR